MVEADIEGFFDHIDHQWLQRMIAQRVNDSAFMRLIGKWLKAGVLEEANEVVHPEEGTPQGGVVSPVLANIYLHYALDLWTEKVVRKQAEGEMVYERYADDFVCGFERKEDAQRYLEMLRERLAKFGLKLAEAKSGIVRFSRLDRKESGMFTFLGFEFYWAKTRKGAPTVKRRTSKKKYRNALARMTEWLRSNRCQRLSSLRDTLARKLAGYWNYYGVIGNFAALAKYWRAVKQLCWRWLNRRSQRRSYRTQGFDALWEAWGLPLPRIVEKPYRPAGAR